MAGGGGFVSWVDLRAWGDFLQTGDNHALTGFQTGFDGTVAKLAMRQPFVLFKGLTFQKLCLPGA
ncbi:hypothetical protein SNB01_23045, partial [Escherichia coli]|nr:hypothetical protein [Escherichia coli]